MPNQAIIAELQDQIDRQKNKFHFVYPQTILVPYRSADFNETSAVATIDIASDAPFRIERITMSAMGPVDANGFRVYDDGTNPLTQFPLAGTDPLGTEIQYAEHGVSVRISEGGSNREFTDGFVPLELIATPGYREAFYHPLPFNYLVKERSQLRFEFQNRDAAPEYETNQYFHLVSLALIGSKYVVPSGARINWED
jgi:hypothetical protein